MAGFRGGYGGFGGGMQMQKLMKEAQKMQAEMEKAQRELEETEFEGESGSGLVKVVLSGKKVLKSISIKAEAVDPDDVEMLEDLIVVAFNDANKKIDAVVDKNQLLKAGGI